MEYVKIGKLIKTYGLQGEVKVFSTTDFPEIRFKRNNEILMQDRFTNEYKPLIVSKSHCASGNIFVISFKNLNHINHVEALIGNELFIEKDSKSLSDGFYYYSDLETCDVYNESNNLLGKVNKVENFNGKISIRIDISNGKQILVPFVDFFIKNVNIENRKITIKVIEGLL